MLIEEALTQLLSPLAPVHSFKLPRKVALPAITYMKVSAPRDQTLSGPSGLVSARFQVTSWGNTYDSAKVLSDSVRRTLDGYRGYNGVRIDGIQLLNEIDGNEPEPDTYQTHMDFRIKYSEERDGHDE